MPQGENKPEAELSKNWKTKRILETNVLQCTLQINQNLEAIFELEIKP